MGLLKIGIDVGSTTVKFVVLDDNNQILYSEYRRHYSDTKKTITDLFNEVLDKFKENTFTIVTTGSGAITGSGVGAYTTGASTTGSTASFTSSVGIGAVFSKGFAPP